MSVTRCRWKSAAILVLLAAGGCTVEDSARPAPADGPEASAPGSAPVLAPADWLSGVQQGIADSEYQLAEADDGSLSFANRAQNLRARFEADGSVLVTPRGGETGPLTEGLGPFELRMRTVAWGREGAMRDLGVGRTGVGDCDGTGRLDTDGDCLRRTVREAEGIEEWWQNDERGLEQGWVIEERPEGEGELRIAVDVGGARVEVDADGLGARLSVGGNAVEYGELRAWDRAGRELEARIEASEDGLLVVVDDEGASWPVVVDPLLTTVGWAAEPNQIGANFGYSVASAGDVNGDGFGDVLVGAPPYTNGQNSEGRAFLYLGSASGLAVSPAWTAESDQTGAQFGWSVASAGDVNGDGFGDVLVGAYLYDNGQTDEGRAYLYLGSASGLAASPAWTAESDQGFANFGTSVASAGDVNGDGFGDVLVGAWFYDNGQNNEGRAYSTSAPPRAPPPAPPGPRSPTRPTRGSAFGSLRPVT